MISNLLSLAFGLLFGFGLIIAQMINPAKVLAFLDVAGQWDPSLALVMAGALTVLGISHRARLAACDLDEAGSLASRRKQIDKQLVAGSAVFGIGWGLSGICPGPAIVGLSFGLSGITVYALSMFAGFLLFKWTRR